MSKIEISVETANGLLPILEFQVEELDKRIKQDLLTKKAIEDLLQKLKAVETGNYACEKSSVSN